MSLNNQRCAPPHSMSCFPANEIGVATEELSPGGVGKVDQAEIYVGATYSIFSAKFSYGLTNFFGLGDGTTTSRATAPNCGSAIRWRKL